jgi:hypothetical protein
MAKYCVQRIEVHRQDVLLEADSASQAIRLVTEGEGDEAEIHYDRTLDPGEWLAFEIP